MKHAFNALIYAAQGGNATNDTPTLIRTMRDDLIKTGCDPNGEYLRAAGERARMLDAGLKAARAARPGSILESFRDLGCRLLDRIATPFQQRSVDWLNEICWDDPTDLAERRARFIEEALELVQSLDMTESDVMQVVGYVFNRPSGLPAQEFGGVATTLAVLADYTGYDLMDCGEDELERVSEPEVMDKIRRKRMTRHGRGPLPGDSPVERDPIAENRIIGQFVNDQITAIEATRNSQASEKFVAGSITADHIPSGDALVEERARLVAENEAAPGWGAAVGERHERIREIDRELKRRG